MGVFNMNDAPSEEASVSLTFREVVEQMMAAPDRPTRDTVPSIRLSQNEMPWEPAPVVAKAMMQALHTVHRYPDFHRTAVRAVLAESFEVTPDRVAIDNGSGSLLHGLARLVCEPGVRGIYGWPSFEAYPAALRLAGAEASAVPLTMGGAMSLPALLAAIDPSTRIVYLCNPNNPTGGLFGTGELRDFLQGVPSHVLVVLDEAYREFVTAEPLNANVKMLDEFDNLVILRTLSKSHGLAGVRAGYAVGAYRVAEALRRTSVGFALNSVAEAAVVAAFSANGLAVSGERIATVVAQRERLENALRERGVSFIPSQSNFIFVLGDIVELSTKFEAHDILARPFPHSGGIRVTVGTRAENDVVIAALT